MLYENNIGPKDFFKIYFDQSDSSCSLSPHLRVQQVPQDATLVGAKPPSHSFNSFIEDTKYLYTRCIELVYLINEMYIMV